LNAAGQIDAPPKPITWLGESRRNLRTFPEDVKDDIGVALFWAQKGGKHADAKALYGFGGAGVLEVVEDHDGDTYRAVYTVKFAERVYVLHCFQKEIEEARQNTATRQGFDPQAAQASRKTGRTMAKEISKMSGDIIDFEEGSENVFADIGVRDPEESLLRAKLARQIADLIKKRGLSQNQIGAILGVDQSKVSKIVRGRISGFTSDRLFRFLNALGCDVRIEVGAAKTTKLAAAGARAARGRIVVVGL
jgi:phage-related protein/predicted XRE-type DNA-binding protein